MNKSEVSKKILGYKVRNINSGLYLSSVPKNKWTKIGKTWPRQGDVTRTINFGLLSAQNQQSTKHYDEIINDIPNWEVVELSEASTLPVLFLINKLKG